MFLSFYKLLGFPSLDRELGEAPIYKYVEFRGKIWSLLCWFCWGTILYGVTKFCVTAFFLDSLFKNDWRVKNLGKGIVSPSWAKGRFVFPDQDNVVQRLCRFPSSLCRRWGFPKLGFLSEDKIHSWEAPSWATTHHAHGTLGTRAIDVSLRFCLSGVITFFVSHSGVLCIQTVFMNLWHVKKSSNFKVWQISLFKTSSWSWKLFFLLNFISF